MNLRARHPSCFVVFIQGCWEQITSVQRRGSSDQHPDDTASVEERRSSKRAWLQKTILEAYLRHGSRAERWDKAVSQLLCRTIDAWSDDRLAVDASVLDEGCKRALELGCDDAFVLFMQALLRCVRVDDSAPETALLLERSAGRLKKTAYPAIRRYIPFRLAAEVWWRTQPKPSKGLKKKVRRLLDEAFALYPEVLADETLPADLCLNGCKHLAEVEHRVTGDLDGAYQRIREMVARVRPFPALVSALEGEHLLQAAETIHDAVKKGTLPREQWSVYETKLGQAEVALTRAWDLGRQPSVASRLVRLSKQVENGRAKMDQWLARALEVDPDNFDACEEMVHGLQPGWGGSGKGALAFGRKCLKWFDDDPKMHPRMALIIVAAHKWVAGGVFARGRTDDEKWKGYYDYFRRPAVWKEYAAAHRAIVKRYPGSRLYRSLLARRAYEAGQWTEAHRQFEILGDDVTVAVFEGKARDIKIMRETAAYRARLAASQGQ